VAVLQSFSRMICLDDIAAFQVGYRPRELQNAVKGTSRQVKLLHGGTKQALRWRLDDT
jgi:hypothetical protein